ncbi:MAG: CopD family protein [Candidatus Latescibacterota bacterium]
MSATLMEFYLPLKSLHIISVVLWMAGLIYLPSILAHHTRVAADSEAAQSFADIERRLLRALMNPAMALAFITGIALIIGTGAGGPGTGYWMHVKLLLLLLLAGMHGIMSASRKRLERGENQKNEDFFQRLAVAPVVFLVVIVLLVVVKPF